MISGMIEYNEVAASLLAHVLIPADYSTNAQEIAMMIYEHWNCSKITKAFREANVRRIGLQQFKNLLSSQELSGSIATLVSRLSAPAELMKMLSGQKMH